MVHLTRAAAAAICLLTLAGCSAGDGPGVSAPPLPPGVLLQLAVPDTGEVYRITDDGTYLVTGPDGEERREQPASRFERGARTVSAAGLTRLRAALRDAGFFDLPADVATGDCVTGTTVIRNSGRRVMLRTLVFSARDGDREATVTTKADLGAPCTLAELEPVYRAFDAEALGDWRNE